MVDVQIVAATVPVACPDNLDGNPRTESPAVAVQNDSRDHRIQDLEEQIYRLSALLESTRRELNLVDRSDAPVRDATAHPSVTILVGSSASQAAIPCVQQVYRCHHITPQENQRGYIAIPAASLRYIEYARRRGMICKPDCSCTWRHTFAF